MERAFFAIACVSLLLFLFSSLTPSAYAEDVEYNCRGPFSGGPGISPPPDYKYNLPYLSGLVITGQKYDIPFDGYLTNVTANIDRHSIEFVGRSEGALLQVRLPRALIDSTQDNHDIPFTVLVNGQPINNTTQIVVPSTGDRMVCIPLPFFGSMSRVEIIGTTMAPEFGSLSLVVASIATAGIVVFSVMSNKRLKM